MLKRHTAKILDSAQQALIVVGKPPLELRMPPNGERSDSLAGESWPLTPPQTRVVSLRAPSEAEPSMLTRPADASQIGRYRPSHERSARPCYPLENGTGTALRNAHVGMPTGRSVQDPPRRGVRQGTGA